MTKLERFAKLYKSSECMGSAAILREYLGLPPGFVVPLSIAHGVDMNHCSTAMDVQSVEPIHWSYNDSIHARASKVKQSVRLPHPWLMLRMMRPRNDHGSGTLVIGPPPGRSNDEALLKCLKSGRWTNFDVLVKRRGQAVDSANYWAQEGVRTRAAGEPDSGFYERLRSILDGYEQVVGCTLSSALFFAAVLGKRCALLTDYRYSAYEVPGYLDHIDFNAPVARQFVEALKREAHSESMALASEILGAGLIASQTSLRTELDAAIRGIRWPLHHHGGGNAIARRIAGAIALHTGRTGLVRHRLKDLLKRRLRNQVCLVKLNEVDMWLHGMSASNFEVRTVSYVPRLTEPGWAVD